MLQIFSCFSNTVRIKYAQIFSMTHLSIHLGPIMCIIYFSVNYVTCNRFLYSEEFPLLRVVKVAACLHMPLDCCRLLWTQRFPLYLWWKTTIGRWEKPRVCFMHLANLTCCCPNAHIKHQTSKCATFQRLWPRLQLQLQLPQRLQSCVNDLNIATFVS